MLTLLYPRRPEFFERFCANLLIQHLFMLTDWSIVRCRGLPWISHCRWKVVINGNAPFALLVLIGTLLGAIKREWIVNCPGSSWPCCIAGEKRGLPCLYWDQSMSLDYIGQCIVLSTCLHTFRIFWMSAACPG